MTLAVRRSDRAQKNLCLGAATVTCTCQSLPAAGAASTRSRCFTSLMQAIDKHSYKPDHECMRFGSDDDFNVSEMMGKMIVYKWGPISWYLARVHKLAPNQGGEGHNCLLTFDLSDGKEAAVALYPSNQVQFFNTLDETATQAQYSWMPVKQVQLDASQDVAASAITSPKKRKPGGGRPPHVRWAPAVGPTSKKPKAARKPWRAIARSSCVMPCASTATDPS